MRTIFEKVVIESLPLPTSADNEDADLFWKITIFFYFFYFSPLRKVSGVEVIDHTLNGLTSLYVNYYVIALLESRSTIAPEFLKKHFVICLGDNKLQGTLPTFKGNV